MTYEIMSTDGIGVRALLGVAEKLHELTEERGILLGVIEGEAIGEDYPVGVVMAKADGGKNNALAVTIEANPRIIRYTKDEAEPDG